MSNAPLLELERRLSDLCTRARAEADRPDADRQTAAAYARGLADALDLFRLYLPVSLEVPPDQMPEKQLRLHQMAPGDVARMDISGCPTDDLVEAAFTFETVLMGLLEDDNTPPFDLYSGLSPAQLEGIIKKAVENICRIQTP